MGSFRTLRFYVNSFYLNRSYVASGFRLSLCTQNVHLVDLVLSVFAKYASLKDFGCVHRKFHQEASGLHTSSLVHKFSTILYSRFGL